MNNDLRSYIASIPAKIENYDYIIIKHIWQGYLTLNLIFLPKPNVALVYLLARKRPDAVILFSARNLAN